MRAEAGTLAEGMPLVGMREVGMPAEGMPQVEMRPAAWATRVAALPRTRTAWFGRWVATRRPVEWAVAPRRLRSGHAARNSRREARSRLARAEWAIEPRARASRPRR